MFLYGSWYLSTIGWLLSTTPWDNVNSQSIPWDELCKIEQRRMENPYSRAQSATHHSDNVTMLHPHSTTGDDTSQVVYIKIYVPRFIPEHQKQIKSRSVRCPACRNQLTPDVQTQPKALINRNADAHKYLPLNRLTQYFFRLTTKQMMPKRWEKTIENTQKKQYYWQNKKRSQAALAHWGKHQSITLPTPKLPSFFISYENHYGNCRSIEIVVVVEVAHAHAEHKIILRSLCDNVTIHRILSYCRYCAVGVSNYSDENNVLIDTSFYSIIS